MVEEESNESVEKYKKSLSFSKIVKVTGDKPDEFYQSEFKRLPKYKRGSRDSKGSGFRPLESEFEIPEFYVKIHSKSEDDALGKLGCVDVKRILKTQYVSEKYSGSSDEPSEVTVDIFWIREHDLMLMNGPKKLCSNAFDEIINLGTLNLKEIKFVHDFLMWIPYRLNIANGELYPELFVTIIADGVTQNKSSTGFVPKKISIDKSIEALMALPSIYGLVNQHKFYLIGGDFKFRSKFLKVKLSNDGIHIKINNTLKNKDHGERCAIVFPFIIEMVNVLKYWKGLNAKERYPDEQFLKYLEDTFDEQVKECKDNFKKLREDYKKRRNS
ncbi:hypothetical protein [Methanobacterium sp.]|uniref:hypothetical protein n=1 Tax=Methanobacterium sp. TaxID=2164 RepID=UPI002ABB986D|nr:hypothetical protein [Methanobacterium sp.]MDY9922807.1 hypothetical protein [Methanobacterium sp.]